MLRRLTLERVRNGLAHPGAAVRIVATDIAANLAFHLTPGYSPNPEFVVIALGQKCNLRCRMCPQWGERGVSLDLSNDELSELTVDKLAPFAAELSAFKPRIHLTGGETLLAREAVGIIELLKSMGLRVSLTTNGTLLAGKADRLVELGVDEIVVSVDGTEATHDSIRGVKGTFGRMMEGIEAVDAAKLARGVTRPRITTQTTLTADNSDSLHDLVTYLAETPVNTITIHHLEFTTPEILENHYRAFAEEFDIEEDTSWSGLPQEPEIEATALLKSIRSLSEIDLGGRDLKIVPALNEAETVEYYRDASYFPKHYSDKCLFPWKGLIVHPNGNLFACPNYLVGNLTTDSFRDVWNGDDYRRIRSVLKRRRAFPICSRCCWFYYHSL